MKSILIQNYHDQGTWSLVRDFSDLGFKVYMPKDNFNGVIDYFFPNDRFKAISNVHLVSFDEFREVKPEFILVACFAQLHAFTHLRELTNSKLILHAATNNVPYPEGISDYLLSPDIQTYTKLNIKRKCLYFPEVRFKPNPDFPLADRLFTYKINTYISFYQEYWPEAFAYAKTFSNLFAEYNDVGVGFFGQDSEQGLILEDEVRYRMRESAFTLNFKEKDAYGYSVLESMSQSTPVISMRKYIQEITLGTHILNHSNSLIVDSPEEAMERLKNLTMSAYKKMAENAYKSYKKVTDKETRLANISSLLEL